MLSYSVISTTIRLKPSYYEVSKGISQWKEAMQLELNALVKNHTWPLVLKPKGCRPITYKLVYRVKLKCDSNLDKYKSCVVS